MNAKFEDWKSELLEVGNIVQDDDSNFSPDEAERRFNRYIEMLDNLHGSEGEVFAFAIMQSVQAVHDYGAYQVASRTLWRFGETSYCKVLIEELPRLISSIPDWAGDFLVSIANGQGTKSESVIDKFNELLFDSGEERRNTIVNYIKEQENGGWLRDRVGVLG